MPRKCGHGGVIRIVLVAVLAFSCGPLWAAGTGSISGTVQDQTNAVLPGVSVFATNVALSTQYKTTTDATGYYTLPDLPVGQYNLDFEAAGFTTQLKTNIAVNIDSALTINATMLVSKTSESVTVQASPSQAQVETVATSLGEVVPGKQAIALPLNGRSYTDLLSIQAGVAPITTLTPTSVIMAGVTGAINPSGDLNPGDQSINGQRESANGFMVNGVDVRENMNGGTSIIPNIDSIDEFRVLTDNFDPEYGNYDGGLINVVTKSGTNQFHGTAFEFLRNTALDAKNYFATTRSVYRQNQFGGTVGGPIRKDKVFFFSDYQGTRTTQGVTSPLITVPSVQDRTGNLSDVASTLTGTVSGPNLANLLSNELGYTVTQGEPFYFSGCTSAHCVLPGAVIPQSAFSAPAQNLLQYIPGPSLPGNQFSTSAYNETVRDDKGSVRFDANTGWGQVTGYYFVDNYRLDNPYPGGQGGASVPGFDALTIGQAQEFSLSDTKVLGATTVNEFHLGILRNANIVGEPNGGLGVSLASQGFVTGAGTSGITVQAPQYEGVENLVFPNFVMGVPVTNVDQWNNTLFLSDSVSKVVGTHTIKIGGEFHLDQVNEHPNATFNGTFIINGTETGNAFADFLLGVPSNFTQSTGQPFYLRDHYLALFGEDSWHARSNLTLNYGVRWEVIRPWSEKYNNIQTYIPGAQSVLYPNAIPGMVVPGDPGIPSTISPTKWHEFAPRIGVAYAPSFDHGLLKKIFGANGDSSIRASFGIYYTAFPGLAAGIMYGVPPFGYNYLSPSPPLFATPFVNAGDGTVNTNPFPLAFPPHSVSASNPDTSFNWASVTPISADPFWYYRNTVPYTENYMLSVQRRIATNLLLTVSYVGNQGHHELVMQSANPGNAALCLSLSQPSEVQPGTQTCGPYGEDGTYTSALGQVYQGTRNLPGTQGGLYPGNYQENTADKSIGNSSFNALETNLRYTGVWSTFLLSYTYSKSMDQASNIGDQINPFNQQLSWELSSWDMTHNFVASYHTDLPFDHFFGKSRLTDGWSLAGTIRFATGFPVTLIDNSDNSLLGTLGNGVNNYLLDTPQFTPGALNINTNPRNGKPAFNTGLFAPEPLGVLGNVPRRFFHGPGINDFDVQLTKNIRLTESQSLDLRIEAFNVFNHPQFYGPSAVDGTIQDSNFGQIVSAQAPRLVQLAAKFYF
jgi:Carboxypeptidase regulatory-like domain